MSIRHQNSANIRTRAIGMGLENCGGLRLRVEVW